MKYLIFAFVVQSALAAPVDTFLCSKEHKKFFDEWKATGEWSKQSQGGLETSFFQSPTDKVGEWVVAKEIPQGSVISKIGQHGRIEVAFKGIDCKQETKSYPHSAPIKGLKNDDDLEKFVKSNKEGAIYVWSPRMTLSQKGIPEIMKASRNLKLPVLVLLDKDIPDQEFKKLKKELGPVVTERVDSLEFRMRNIGQHFPAMIVFKDSKILPEVKYGFEKSDRYQSDLVRMLGKGK